MNWRLLPVHLGLQHAKKSRADAHERFLCPYERISINESTLSDKANF